jgi:hypothetical protein
MRNIKNLRVTTKTLKRICLEAANKFNIIDLKFSRGWREKFFEIKKLCFR